jgi:hypothetical protein
MNYFWSGFEKQSSKNSALALFHRARLESINPTFQKAKSAHLLNKAIMGVPGVNITDKAREAASKLHEQIKEMASQWKDSVKYLKPYKHIQ